MGRERPRTRRRLWEFILTEFGLLLPHRPLTPGHSTPFEFIWDAFTNPGKKIAVWANRSGLKTLCASIIAALEYRFADRPMHSRVLAGSEEQGRALYGYWERWCYTVLAHHLAADPGRRITRLANGDFEILAASQKRVRGAKIQRLYRDEEDEIDPEISAASVGMLAGRPGVPARTIVTSTWHNLGGAMGALVRDDRHKGFALHKWNIWEALQRCLPERHDEGRNCPGCPLGEVCLAKARESDPDAHIGVASRCRGLLAIDDVVGQLQEWSLQQWQAEAECRRPTLDGLVYPQFDRARHVVHNLNFRPHLPTYRAVDWGLNNFVCLWAQIDHDRVIHVVDEYWAQDATTGQNAAEIVRRDRQRAVAATFCDPAGRNRSDQTGLANVDIFASVGLPCRYRTDRWAKAVQNGVGLIRAALRPASGEPRMLVAGRCRQLIAAFEAYTLRKVNNEYVDEPRKPQEPWEHPMDALRYLLVNTHAPARAAARQMGYS